MRPRQQKRMEQIERAVAALPIRGDVVQKGFEHFRETGELPEEQRLAAEVVQQALRGGQPLPPTTAAYRSDLDRLIEVTVLRNQDSPKQVSIREHLFDEAVYGPGVVSRAARCALRLEVDFGGDVADSNFLADRTLPEYGTVGLHLLGFPQCLAKAPYEKQAQRLFTRYDELRIRINRYGDDPWFDMFTDTVLRFQDTGELPDDELLRDVVLADAELDALWRHRRGHDVAALMEALDRAAKAKGPKRAAAIASVQELVRAGQVLRE